MSTPDLPQSGWHKDVEWAKCLDESVETFRDKCKKNNIPHRKWGRTLIVLAEDFYTHLPEPDNANEESE